MGEQRRSPERRDDRGQVFDAYPDHDLAPPRVRLYWIAVVDEEPIDGEAVDTDGFSARQLIPGLQRSDRRRSWLVARLDEAHARLIARIGPADDEPS